MNLFNKYKSKDFLYLTNIINYTKNGYGDIELPEVIKKLKEYGTFTEVIEYIENNNEENIFKFAKNKIIPKQKEDVPIVLSYHERAWLYAILNDEKARLFLDDKSIKQLKNALESQNNGKPYPISNNEIYRNKLNDKPQHHYTDEEIDIFKKLIDAVTNHKYITITNEAFTGHIYKDSKLIPYKIEYNYKQDTFSVTCLNKEKMELVRVFFFNIKKITVNEEIENYDKIHSQIENLLNKKRASIPITIKILGNQNVFQRCSYSFSYYDTISYKKDNNIYMDIKYYDFQYNC